MPIVAIAMLGEYKVAGVMVILHCRAGRHSS
jgi:hypothetical protein